MNARQRAHVEIRTQRLTDWLLRECPRGRGHERDEVERILRYYIRLHDLVRAVQGFLRRSSAGADEQRELGRCAHQFRNY